MPDIRDSKWDNCKFLLILFVVIGHTFQSFAVSGTLSDSVFTFIYLFHMPAFIFLNGLFSKRTVDNKRYEKIIPYILIYCFIIFLRAIADFLRKKNSFSFSVADDTNYSWYMIALFFIYLIAVALSKYEAKYVIPFTVVIALVAGYSSELYKDYQLFGRVISFLPFFMIGYYTDTEKLRKFLSRPVIRIVSALVLVGVFVFLIYKVNDVAWIVNVLKGKSGYDDIKFTYAEKFGMLIKLCWYLVAVLLSLCFMAVVPSIKTPISKLGSRTLQVYVLHMPLNNVIMKALGLEKYILKTFPSYSTEIFAAYAVILTFVLSSGFITPFFSLFFKIKPKKHVGASEAVPETVKVSVTEETK